MPWSKPKKVEGIVAPVERIEQLRKLRDQAADLSELEQLHESTSLAQSIQNENDPLIRGQILRTLSAFPTPVATAVLKAAMQDRDSDVRVACCDAWADRGGPEALDALTQIMGKDADIDVRLAAMRALGKLKDPGAIPALGIALDDRDPAVQYRAIQSLREITERDFGDDVRAWRDFVNGANPPEQSIAGRLLRWF